MRLIRLTDTRADDLAAGGALPLLPAPPLVVGGQGRTGHDLTRSFRTVRVLCRLSWRWLMTPMT